MGERGKLPNHILHRFPGKVKDQSVGPNPDVRTFTLDGVKMVCKAAETNPSGVSFLDLTPDFTERVHKSFKGQCYVTAPREQLCGGLYMVYTGKFYRRLDGPHGKLVLVGRHFGLIPRLSIPFDEYEKEAERLKSIQCQWKAGAEPLDWPPDTFPPGDRLMCYVSQALRQLAMRGSEEPHLRVLAGLNYLNISAVEVEYDDMLADTPLMALVQHAWSSFQPPSDDEVLLASSDCYKIGEDLQKLQVGPIYNQSRIQSL
jgi:hypothetical protein